MPWASKIHRPSGSQHKAKRVREVNRTKAGYDNKWSAYSRGYLKSHPLCVECMKHGDRTPSEHTDHIRPHKGDMRVFWDPTNHQALCRVCHGVKTAREDGGFGNPKQPHD